MKRCDRTCRWLRIAVGIGGVLALASVAPGKDLLGNDLGDLEKSLEALPPAKPHAKTVPSLHDAGPASTAVKQDEGQTARPPPEKPKQPITPPVRSEVGKKSPPAQVTPAVDGAVRVPPGVGSTPPPAVRGGNLLAEQWALNLGGGTAAIKGGALVLSAGARSPSTTASFRNKLEGDFDLLLEVVYGAPGAAGKPGLMRGFGIRIESAAGWKGQRQVTVDRSSDRQGDILLAGAAGERVNLQARPKTSATLLRIQRRHDKFNVCYREENGKEWLLLGDIEARMSPQLELWLTAYGYGGEVSAVVRHVEVMPPAINR